MSIVDQHNIATSTTKLDPSPPGPAPPPAATLPSLVPLDFAPNPALRQVTTLLRRIWLLDPPLSDEELADPKTVQECLQSVTQIVSSGEDQRPPPTSDTTTGEDDDDDDDDDDVWKSKTQFRLLDDPVVVSADKEQEAKEEAASGKEEEEQERALWLLKSVVSPWRQEIYDVYRHVFADLWRMTVVLVQQQQQEPTGGSGGGVGGKPQVGRYEPTRGDAVSVGALKKERGKTPTTFETDTFVYPVWVNPDAEITFSSSSSAGEEEEEEEEKHCWRAGEAKTWTTGLWVQAGKTMTLRTTGWDGDGDGDKLAADRTGLAAVFVTGHCDERERD